MKDTTERQLEILAAVATMLSLIVAIIAYLWPRSGTEIQLPPTLAVLDTRQAELSKQLTAVAEKQPSGTVYSTDLQVTLAAVKAEKSALESTIVASGSRFPQTATIAPTDTPIPPTLVPPTSTPLPLKVIEDFGHYSSDNQLRATYTPNAGWETNRALIRLDNVYGVSTMRLDYDIRGQTTSDNYVVLDRCFQPSQDWRGARYIEIWVQNDSKPKQAIVQFGEGHRCTGGDFPFEVWRIVANIAPGQKGTIPLPLNNFEQETGWARSLNNRIDLDTIGYFALGIRGSSLGEGTIHFGPVRLLP